MSRQTEWQLLSFHTRPNREREGDESKGLEEGAGPVGARTLSCHDSCYQGSAQGQVEPWGKLLINGVYSTAVNWGESACLIT